MSIRIAIIGPGAVGGAVAAHLSSITDHEIILCARTPLTDLRITLPSGKILTSQPVVLTQPVIGAPVDWVLVTTKAYDVAGAAKWFPTLVGPDTRIAILQNGIEHVDRFRDHADPAQLLPVMVDIPAERRGPGRIDQRGPGTLRVPDGVAGRAFAALFASTEIDAATSLDFLSTVWRKLALNVIGAVNALTLKPTGIVHQPAIATLMHTMIREAIAVARAEGAMLDETLADEIIAGQLTAPLDSVNSLHADRLASRPMEVDARNGAVVRAGLRHGIPTPLNTMAVALLSAQQPDGNIRR